MEPKIQIDYIGAGGSVSGEVASELRKKGSLNVNMMRPWVDERTGEAFVTLHKGGPVDKLSSYGNFHVNTGTLRRDEWKQLDDVVLKIQRERLSVVDDLIAAGLTYNLTNAMGTTVLEYHDISEAMNAEMSMDAISKTPADRPVYGTNYMPIPIIHADFHLNLRELEVSRRNGNPLDTIGLEMAVRRILEYREDLLITSKSYTYGGGTIYSFLNFPKRNTLTLTETWDDSATGADIKTDVINMKKALVADHQYGPYMLYIPTDYEGRLDDDYTTGYPKTLRARLMELDNLKGIKVVDRLAEANILMVAMNTSTVRIINGLAIQVIEWKTEGGFVSHYKVICIQVPQIRADQAGHCGVLHASIT